jgi:hypothetical protein
MSHKSESDDDSTCSYSSSDSSLSGETIGIIKIPKRG